MGRRRTFALLVGQAYEYYQSSFIEGFLKVLFEEDCDVCVFAMYEKYQNTAAREIGETSIFKLVPYDRFDGFVLMLDTLQTPGLADSVMKDVRSKVKVPVITVDKDLEDYICVRPKDYEGIKALISHLIEEHGYTDIAFLTGKSWHPYSKERLKAYQDCMEEHGLKIRDNRIFFGDFWYTSGENLGDKLVKMNGALPQAIACANDQMAVGLAKSLTGHGLRVPEDVAIVGYDSNDEGRYSPKPITSVTLPAEALGEHAARTLSALVGGYEVPEFNDPIDIFYGTSCGCSNETSSMVSKLRKTWSTDLSTNSVLSPFNHIDEDLLSQSTFFGLMNTVFSYTYQIRPFEGFSLCLNDDWQHYNTGDIRNDDPFTSKMVHVLYCGPENSGHDKIGIDEFFDKDDLIPYLSDESDRPRVFFFTPIYFENTAYGYAVYSSHEPKSHSENYRIWLRSIMRGLEYFRRQEQLKLTNAALEANMIRDPLTGFYNYKGFQYHIESALNKFKNGDPEIELGIIAIDIKNLSGINNDYGREEGDAAIVKMAGVLRKVADNECIYALGNGEYFVAARIDGRDLKVSTFTEDTDKLLSELNDQDSRFKLEISYGSSKGTVVTKNDFERLVGIAVNNKNVRKRNIAKIEEGEGLTKEEQEQAKIVHEIIENNLLKYHFQPIIRANTGEIYAYEALMRADVKPYMAPPVVLRYAEFFNRLYDIEKATFNNVLDIFESNEESFAEGSKLFINSIPGHVLKDSDFEVVAEKIANNTDRIVVEYTEQSELKESEMAKIKKRYEDAGLKTAIDDYGTGYSNITNLLNYMPDYVKIDRMLLTNIHKSPQKQHFVKDIITFSHENGIMALAEGIETAEEYKVVLELGVDLVQGFFVAEPSPVIVKEIDPSVRKTIEELNRVTINDKKSNIYIAGREGRISLPVLVEEGYSKIVLPNSEMTYRDITIAGAPGLDTDFYIVAEDGYQGSLVLENVGLSGLQTGNCIQIGEGCDVMIGIVGECFLEDGGIRVPSSSRVIFSGDGSLKISVNRLEAYGIGNALMTSHGDLVFDQDGTIEINIDSAQGIGIGAGNGGDIRINRGRYLINMSGQSGVGIGSILGETQPIVTNCECHVVNTATRGVAIGSIEGDCDIYIDKMSLECRLSGSEGVVIGSLSGRRSSSSINNGYVLVEGKADKLMCVGSLSSESTLVMVNLSTLNFEFSGKSSAFIGSFEPNAKLSITSCTISVNGNSDYDELFAAPEDNIVFSDCQCKAQINGKDKTRIEFN